MAGTKILILGGTGVSGICLLRELVHRNIPAVVYARNPAKIPEDLANNSLLEVDLTTFHSTQGSHLVQHPTNK
jgi:putative NADH-flavin reductase